MFNSIPFSYQNQSDNPTIPADALPDVLCQFSQLYGVELVTHGQRNGDAPHATGNQPRDRSHAAGPPTAHCREDAT